jgi:hypothetical protein
MFNLSPVVKQFLIDTLCNALKFLLGVFILVILTGLITQFPYQFLFVILCLIAGAIITLINMWWKIRHLQKVKI